MLHIVNLENGASALKLLEIAIADKDIVVLMNIDSQKCLGACEKLWAKCSTAQWYRLSAPTNSLPLLKVMKNSEIPEIDHPTLVNLTLETSPISSWY